MKIQTNAGDVELTAEMVCKGMVFRWGRTTFTIADPDQDWITAEERVCGRDLPQRADRFLGCDPAIASRADCERFGVHGDAAAHGFARLRDGGALDLRRVPVRGAVALDTEHGARFEAHDCTLRVTDRFLGLDPRHASPEDVRRLCCGADHPDIGGFVASCSLAIGPHDEHEDLATGVKWSAKRGCPECPAGEGQRCAADCPRVARYKATRCGARPERGQVLGGPENRIATGEERCNNEAGKCSGHSLAENFDFLHWSEPATFLDCPICAQRIMPYGDFGPVGFCVYDPKAGKSRSAPVCEACYKVHGSNVAALRWEGTSLVPKDDGPLTLEDIGVMAREDGYDASVKRGPAVIRVTVYGADEAYCQRFLRRIEDRTPADCAVFVEAAPARASVTVRCPCDALGRGAPGLHTKDCKAGRALKWEMGTASLGQSQAHVLRDGDVYRWQVNHLGLRIRDGVEPHTFDAHEAAGRILFAVHDATAGIEWLAGFFGLLFRVHDSTPAAKRAKQEAPLVALVAAVPEGLDPIGWRAAVLAQHEAITADDRAAGLSPWEFFEDRLRCDIENGGKGLAHGSWTHVAWAAYHRAIAPAPKVDRERTTWKTRGPVLAVDDGRDE